MERFLVFRGDQPLSPPNQAVQVAATTPSSVDDTVMQRMLSEQMLVLVGHDGRTNTSRYVDLSIPPPDKSAVADMERWLLQHRHPHHSPTFKLTVSTVSRRHFPAPKKARRSHAATTARPRKGKAKSVRRSAVAVAKREDAKARQRPSDTSLRRGCVFRVLNALSGGSYRSKKISPLASHERQTRRAHVLQRLIDEQPSFVSRYNLE
jgi:hypothetical protein